MSQPQEPASQSVGRVDLVGAGPGLGDLITVRGQNLLKHADVIVYDRLIDHSLLTLCDPEAELIYVGKSPGCPAKTQDEINALLVEHAQHGKRVLRLKGGDPLIFGRGGEEIAACASAGVPVNIVPGVSSALAIPGAAGIPLTERSLSRSFGVITGHVHGDEAQPQYDYAALAQLDTLVIMMGRKALGEIAEALIAAGRSPDTPAATIASGLLPQQRVVRASLRDIADAVAKADLKPPVITVIGPTAHVGRETEVASPAGAKLFGKRVILTQAYTSTNELRHLLLASGAEVIDVPLIAISHPETVPPLDTALLKDCTFDWLIFTSVNAVRGFWRRLLAAGRDARWLASAKIAVGGPGSARELTHHGLTADLIPQAYSGSGLVQEMIERDELDGRRVLLLQGVSALPHVAEGIVLAGADLTTAAVYATEPSQIDEGQRRILLRGADATIFSSPAAVENYIAQGLADSPTQIACIGPTTASVARQHGLAVVIEPRRPGSTELFHTLVNTLCQSPLK